MPAPESIFALATAVTSEWQPPAIVWHVLLAALIVTEGGTAAVPA
jgi:hypothetical protein